MSYLYSINNLGILAYAKITITTPFSTSNNAEVKKLGQNYS